MCSKLKTSNKTKNIAVLEANKLFKNNVRGFFNLKIECLAPQ